MKGYNFSRHLNTTTNIYLTISASIVQRNQTDRRCHRSLHRKLHQNSIQLCNAEKKPLLRCRRWLHQHGPPAQLPAPHTGYACRLFRNIRYNVYNTSPPLTYIEHASIYENIQSIWSLSCIKAGSFLRMCSSILTKCKICLSFYDDMNTYTNSTQHPLAFFVSVCDSHFIYIISHLHNFEQNTAHTLANTSRHLSMHNTTHSYVKCSLENHINLHNLVKCGYVDLILMTLLGRIIHTLYVMIHFSF